MYVLSHAIVFTIKQICNKISNICNEMLHFDFKHRLTCTLLNDLDIILNYHIKDFYLLY